jgi:hypothetical protein
MEVPKEIFDGETAVVVRMLEEVCATTKPLDVNLSSPRSTATPLDVSLKTVLQISCLGGERVGLLAQMAGAVAAQGFSVVQALKFVQLLFSSNIRLRPSLKQLRLGGLHSKHDTRKSMCRRQRIYGC